LNGKTSRMTRQRLTQLGLFFLAAALLVAWSIRAGHVDRKADDDRPRDPAAKVRTVDDAP
jgi:hypothetical protein